MTYYTIFMVTLFGNTVEYGDGDKIRSREKAVRYAEHLLNSMHVYVRYEIAEHTTC